MEFDNSFDVPLSPAEAWAVLMDIRRIAPCMPGAELTEVVDRAEFRGKISVRLGPVALAFAGRVQIENIDEKQSQRARQGAGQRRQRPRRRQCHGDIPHRAGRERLAGADPHRPDAVRRGGAIRPRRRHDPGDGGADHRSIRRQFACAARTAAARDGADGRVAADRAAETASPLRDPTPPRGDASLPPLRAAPPLPAAKPISGFSLIARVLWQQFAGCSAAGKVDIFHATARDHA